MEGRSEENSSSLLSYSLLFFVEWWRLLHCDTHHMYMHFMHDGINNFGWTISILILPVNIGMMWLRIFGFDFRWSPRAWSACASLCSVLYVFGSSRLFEPRKDQEARLGLHVFFIAVLNLPYENFHLNVQFYLFFGQHMHCSSPSLAIENVCPIWIILALNWPFSNH